MAISANSVFEVRGAGSDLNGGGFVTGAAGTDYSQQDSKNTGASDKSTTDAVANGTTTITSATANFGTTIVGNIIYLAGGTGTLTGTWRQVTARASATSITVDATVASGTGITMNIGGALASPGQAAAIAVASNKIYIKSGTYSVTSSSPNISGGCFASAVNSLVVQGYGSSRDDFGTPPLIQASGISTFVLFTFQSSGDWLVENITVDGASLTSSRGFLCNRGSGYLLNAKNCTNSGFSGSGAGAFVKCTATGCSTQPAFSGTFFELFMCEAYSNTVTGFSTLQGPLVNCLSYNNSGASSDGFAGVFHYNCISYGNGRDGFRPNGVESSCINCIAEGNTGTGFTMASSSQFLLNCAGYNNTAGNTSVGSASRLTNLGFVTGTSTFFVAATSANFALNGTASAGQSARSAGLPGAFVAASTTGYADIGAVQSPPMIPASRRFSGY